MESKELIETLEFHTPDIRWDGFGCPNYESYLKTYLIRSKFHNKVPEDVLKAYETIEYLMAHAYYFYPMYDEAQSKMFRTVEMALKHRCQALGIETTKQVTKKDGTLGIYNLGFRALIKKIQEQEPQKNLQPVLDVLCELRNYAMHPQYNSYYGPMGIPSIKAGINSINTLFADPLYFALLKNLYSKTQEIISAFRNRPLIMELFENPRMLHDIEIVDTFSGDKENVYCMLIHPVMKVKNLQERPSFIPPTVLYVKDLAIKDGAFRGVDLLSGKPFAIYSTDHPENLDVYQGYKNHLEKGKIGNYSPYNAFVNGECSKAINDFRYLYYATLSC